MVAEPNTTVAIIVSNFSVKKGIPMKTLAYGLAAVLGLALPAAAATADRFQFAQAAPSGAGQSGGGQAGAGQSGSAGGAAQSSGTRDSGGAAANRDSARSSDGWC